jgi:hypothetical protein
LNNPQQQPDSSKFDAYLDGSLPAEERDALAREIAASPQLQGQVELQMQIDQALRTRFAPPEMPAELVAKLREAAKVRPAARAKPRSWKTLAAAASAAAVVWGLLAWQYFGNRPQAPDYNPVKPLDTIYATTVAEGFKPAWRCEDDAQFISTFQQRQGQGLLLAAMPTGSRMEGLTYVGGLSRYTTTMLARVNDKPVMVFVDRADTDPHPGLSCGCSDLHLFRKQLGSLVLYELTPFDQPKVMDYLHLAK